MRRRFPKNATLSAMTDIEFSKGNGRLAIGDWTELAKKKAPFVTKFLHKPRMHLPLPTPPPPKDYRDAFGKLF